MIHKPYFDLNDILPKRLGMLKSHFVAFEGFFCFFCSFFFFFFLFFFHTITGNNSVTRIVNLGPKTSTKYLEPSFSTCVEVAINNIIFASRFFNQKRKSLLVD